MTHYVTLEIRGLDEVVRVCDACLDEVDSVMVEYGGTSPMPCTRCGAGDDVASDEVRSLAPDDALVERVDG